MRPGVSKTCVCAMACCHFVCHPQEIRAVPGHRLLRSLSEPPNHHHWQFASLRLTQAANEYNSFPPKQSCLVTFINRQLLQSPYELFEAEGTPPFPVGNRKCIGNRGVNKHGTDWLGHRARVYYLACEISNRFITLQRESGQAEFPATRAAGCEPENQGWLC